MRHILGRLGRDMLRQLAWSNMLLAFDYDGTLAPIVRDPDQAVMRATTRRLLSEVARSYPCVVISGRARADALERLRGVATVEVIGNHGTEPWQVSRRALRAVREWGPLLSRRLAPLQGVTVEDKAYSLAIHYRRSREKAKARAAIQRATSSLGDVRLIRGKQVVNVLPIDAPHKGMALQKARDRFGCDTALYVGDDDTDEDVFALDEPDRLLTVRVGRKLDSLADYFLRSQAEVDAFLRVLQRLGQERQRSAAVRSRR
jgi:trehalose 6-phosphate phosphatase